MKKIISLFLVLSFGLFLSSCGNKSKLKEYKNEVTYDEFISEFEKVTENSILNAYQEKDFYYSYNQETITILDGKETTTNEEIGIKHDIDTYKLYISIGKENSEVYNSENPMYQQMLNTPSLMLSIFYTYQDEVKYYIDGDIFTVVWPHNPKAFAPIGEKIPECICVYQTQIKENSIKVVETMEIEENNKKINTFTVKELLIKDIKL